MPSPIETTEPAIASIAHPVESIISAPLQLQSKAPLPGYKRPSMSRTASGRQYPTKQPTPVPALPTAKEDVDEFGDEFDFSVEDLEELVSQKPLNKRPLHEIPQHPDPPQQQPIALDDNDGVHMLDDHDGKGGDADEDEFEDDDLDEASFAQAEISATQALRASNPSSHLAHPRSR